jgi:hypothetical protein
MAAAASPNSTSSMDSGAPSRISDAITSAFSSARSAARNAEAPARSDPPKSAVATEAGRSHAAAIRPDDDRCQ